jgi:hypothetical protein
MQEPGHHTRSWLKASTLRQARYLGIIQENDSLLGDRFFEDIDRRRSSLASLRLIATAVQIPILAFLVLSLLPVDPGSSTHGMFPASIKSLREILIAVSATLALATSFIGYHHDVLTEILAAHVERRSKGDKGVQEMLAISYGTALFPLPQGIQGRFGLGGGFNLFVRILTTFSALTLVILVLGTITIRVKVLEDIYFAPSFTTVVSVWVIGYVFLCDLVGGLIFLLTSGPINVKNLENTSTKNVTGIPADVAD